MKKQNLKIAILFLLIVSKIEAQQPGDVIITEFMPDPSKVADASGEWLEVYNTSNHAIDLNGWHMSDLKSKNHTISVTDSLIIKANGFLLFAIKADSSVNGGLVPDYTYSNFTFANSAGKIALTNETGIIIDSVYYSSSGAGKSWSLDPLHFLAFENDVPANWCYSNTHYGAGDMGTPGKMNTACLSTAIAPIVAKSAVSLYASNAELNILFPEWVDKQKWEIIDITGRIVQAGYIQESSNRLVITLKRNERGLYFFRLFKSNEILKFILD